MSAGREVHMLPICVKKAKMGNPEYKL